MKWKKQRLKKEVSLLLSAVMIFSATPAALPVYAANGIATIASTNLQLSEDENIGLSCDLKGSWKVSGGWIEGSVEGSTMFFFVTSSNSSSLTITNKYAEPATLSFDFTWSADSTDGSSLTIDGASYSASSADQNFTRENLEAGKSIEVKLTSPKGEKQTSKVTLKKLELKPLSELLKKKEITVKKAEQGSITVDESVLVEDRVLSDLDTGSSISLKAQAQPGYYFAGWIDQDHRLLSEDAQFSYTVEDSKTIAAIFLPTGQSRFDVGDKAFSTLTDAIQEAQSSTQKTVTVATDGILQEDAVIPDGITLLIPYYRGDVGFDIQNEFSPNGSTETVIRKNAYRTLTIPAGKNLELNGNLIVNAAIGCTTQTTDQDINGDYGLIKLEGTINVKAGGIMDVSGLVSGSGQVDVQAGGALRDTFVIRNWRGGSYALAAKNKDVFPYFQSDLKNVSCKTIIHQGASLIGNARLYTGAVLNIPAQFNPARYPQIGSKGQNALFVLDESESGSYAEKLYDGEREKLIFHGAGQFESSGMTISAGGTTENLQTSDFFYPIDGDTDIELNGEWTFNERIKFLPNSTLTIGTGAKLIVSEKTTSKTSSGFFGSGKNRDNGLTFYPYDFTGEVEGHTFIPYPANTDAYVLLKEKATLEAKGDFGGCIKIDPSVNSLDKAAKVYIEKNAYVKSPEITTYNYKSGGIGSTAVATEKEQKAKIEDYELSSGKSYTCFYQGEKLVIQESDLPEQSEIDAESKRTIKEYSKEAQSVDLETLGITKTENQSILYRLEGSDSWVSEAIIPGTYDVKIQSFKTTESTDPILQIEEQAKTYLKALEITHKQLEISFPETPIEKEYDGTNKGPEDLDLQVEGIAAGDEVFVTASSEYESSEVSEDLINLTAHSFAKSGKDEQYYSIPENFQLSDQVGRITPKALDLTLSGLTSKEYDQSTTCDGNGLSFKLDGIVLNEDVTAAADQFSYEKADAGENINITASGIHLQGEKSHNYILKDTAVSGPVGTIRPKSITASLSMEGAEKLEKVYDGNTSVSQEQAEKLILTLTGVYEGDQVEAISPGLYAFESARAGDGIAVVASGITLKGSQALNYQLANGSNEARSLIGNIKPRSIGASISGKTSKVYDGSLSSDGAGLAIELHDLVDPDQVSASAEYRYGDIQAGENKTIIAENITLTGADCENYVLAPASQTLQEECGTITPKELTASLSGYVTKEYDETTEIREHNLSLKLTGIVNQDEVWASGEYAFEDPEMGEDKNVIASHITLSGADCKNYALFKDSAIAAIGNITKPHAVDYGITYDLGQGASWPQGHDFSLLHSTYNEEMEPFEVIEPQKEGYIFEGWLINNTDPVQKQVTIPIEGVSGPLKLEAIWRQERHRIDFELNKGYWSDQNKFETEHPDYHKDDAETEIPVPVKKGYEFAGWKINQEEEIYPALSLPFKDRAEDVLLMAQWKPISYSITFDLGENGLWNNPEWEKILPKSYTIETDSFTVPEPVRKGYVFEGWSINQDHQPRKSLTLPDPACLDDLIIEAIWNLETFEINYDLAGGSWKEGSTFETEHSSYSIFDEEVFVEEPIKEDCIFEGWSINEDPELHESLTIPTDLSGAVSLTAHWSEKAYQVSYDLDQGSWQDNGLFEQSHLTYQNSDQLVTVPSPIKEGYSFLGWKVNESAMYYNTLTLPTSAAKGDLRLKAVWQINSYELTWSYGNGEPDFIQQVNYGSALNYTNPQRTGYIFDGWLAEGKEVLPKTMPAQPLKISAKWTSYTQLLNQLGDLNRQNLDQARDYYEKLCADPEQKQAFESKELFEVIQQVMGEDIHQTLKEAIPHVNELLNPENGQIAHLSLHEKDKNIIDVELDKPETKAKELLNIKFLQDLFSYEMVKDVTIGQESHVSKDQFSLMLAVAWDALHEIYEIESKEAFNKWLQEQADTLEIRVLAGTQISVVLNSIDSKEGVNTTVPYIVRFYITGTEPDFQDLKTIRFDTEGSSTAIPEISKKPGARIAEPDLIPQKTGYSFDGWYTLPSGQGEKFVFSTMPEQDITLYAKWSPIHYTLCFDSGYAGSSQVEGKSPENKTLAYDEGFTIPDCLIEVEGYHFDGWSLENGTIYQPKESVKALSAREDEEIILKAKWSANSYTVSLDAQGGTLDEDELSVFYDSPYGALPEPVYSGYTFAGWRLDGVPVDANTIVKTAWDHSLLASWNANGDTPYKVEVYRENLENEDYVLDEAASKELYGQTSSIVTAPDSPLSGFELNREKSQLEGQVKGDGSLVLQLFYDRQRFDIRFEIDGKTKLQSYKYGALPFHEDPIKEPTEQAGYEFTGWTPAFGEVIGPQTYKAEFREFSQASINGLNYRTIAIALSKAKPGQTVLLNEDVILDEAITIPKDVTLLVPCKDEDGGYEKNGFNPDGTVTSPALGPKGTLYRSLSLTPNASIKVEGTLLVNAVTGRPSAGHYEMETNGGYSQINLEGAIEVEKGGILDVCGYVKGGGSITAKPGGEVRDLYIVKNWRGGSQAFNMVFDVYPMNEVDMHHIESKTIIEAGGSLVGTVKMYAAGSYHYTRFPQINQDNGLIRQTSGQTVKTYDPQTNREALYIEGSGSIAGSTLTILGMGLSTSTFIYPIDGDMDITFSQGQWTLAERLKVLTGTNINFIQNASLTIPIYTDSKSESLLALYDEFEDTVNLSNTRYPKREASILTLDSGSKAEINSAFGGEIAIGKEATRDNPVILDFTWYAKTEASTKEGDGDKGAKRTLTFKAKILGYDKELQAQSRYTCFYDEEGNLIIETAQLEKPSDPIQPPADNKPGQSGGTSGSSGNSGGSGNAGNSGNSGSSGNSGNSGNSGSSGGSGGSGGGGGGGGSSVEPEPEPEPEPEIPSENEPEPEQKPGLPDNILSQDVIQDEAGNTITQTQFSDGSKEEKVEKSDGSISTTTTNSDGSSQKVEESADKNVVVTTTIDSTGTTASLTENKSSGTNKVSGSINVSSQHVEQAKSQGSNVEINMPALEANHQENDVQIEISIPAGVETTIEIPVDASTLVPGSIAMIQNDYGELIPLVNTTSKEGKLVVTLSANAKLVIKDNTKHFLDVSSNTFTYPANGIAYLSARGLMTGVGDGSLFDCLGTVTRAQMATILYRYNGSPKMYNAPLPEGVEADAYYSEAAKWAVSTGLMGVGSNFNPGNLLTREQLAMVLYRIEGEPQVNLAAAEFGGYDDCYTISSPSMETAVRWAVGRKLMGQGTSKLNASGNLARQDLAAMVSRYLQ